MDLALDPALIKRRQRHLVLIIAVLLAQVRVGNIANTINASGIVIPVHEELVSSPIQTHVSKVHAKLGQQVQNGELLLELDDRAVALAIDGVQEQLAQQENRIVALTLELTQKRKQSASAIELQLVA